MLNNAQHSNRIETHIIAHRLAACWEYHRPASSADRQPVNYRIIFYSMMHRIFQSVVGIIAQRIVSNWISSSYSHNHPGNGISIIPKVRDGSSWKYALLLWHWIRTILPDASMQNTQFVALCTVRIAFGRIFRLVRCVNADGRLCKFHADVRTFCKRVDRTLAIHTAHSRSGFVQASGAAPTFRSNNLNPSGDCIVRSMQSK